MRALLFCLALTALAGCSSLVRQDGDYFEAAGVSLEQFETDNSACRTQADDHLTYDLPGMDGTRYQGNRTFNAIYGRCMKARGYRPRPYFKNLLPS